MFPFETPLRSFWILIASRTVTLENSKDASIFTFLKVELSASASPKSGLPSSIFFHEGGTIIFPVTFRCHLPVGSLLVLS